jgi:hypothetical protein
MNMLLFPPLYSNAKVDSQRLKLEQEAAAKMSGFWAVDFDNYKRLQQGR